MATELRWTSADLEVMPDDGKRYEIFRHGGGRKLDPQGDGFATLLRWIELGLPRTPADAPRVTRIAVEPTERLMTTAALQQMIE